MPASTVLLGVCLAVVLGQTLPIATEARRWTKARHSFFLFFVIVSHSTAFRTLGWVVWHPGQVGATLGVPVGVFPAGLTLLVKLSGMLVGVAALVLTFSMARRKQWARVVFTYALPVIYVSGALHVYLGFAKAGGDGDLNGIMGFAICQGICLVCFGWLFAYMWFFYRSSSVDCLFDASEPSHATDAVAEARDDAEGLE